jgi:hypothetical protein
MEASTITAPATLLGAATGGLTSVMATWLTHRTQARAQWLEEDALRRQDLYKEFIEAGARCYVHALRHEQADTPGLVDLYSPRKRRCLEVSTLRTSRKRQRRSLPNPSPVGAPAAMLPARLLRSS